MDIKGIGSELINTYTDSSSSKDVETKFETIFEAALESQDDAELQKACEEYEAYYVQNLFKEMKKTIPKGGLFEDSNERDIFEDMLDEEYSKVISEGRGFGIADALYKQLNPKYGAANPVTPTKKEE